jgi:hypothetical protein
MNTDRKMIQRVWSTDEPFTKVCVGDEEVLLMPKDGNWEIKRVLFDYWEEPCNEFVVIFKKKEGDGAVIKERKHGKWIENEERSGWHCSECKVNNFYAYFWNSEAEQFDLQDYYCPHCGADMRGEINETD